LRGRGGLGVEGGKGEKAWAWVGGRGRRWGDGGTGGFGGGGFGGGLGGEGGSGGLGGRVGAGWVEQMGGLAAVVWEESEVGRGGMKAREEVATAGALEVAKGGGIGGGLGVGE